MRKLLFVAAAILLASAVASAQMQNLDFENWDQPITEEYSSNTPTGWIWTNGTIINPFYNFYYPPSTHAHQNDYALYLSVWYDYTKDAAFQKAAITEKPTTLKGWYQYKHNIIGGPSGESQKDTAMISIFITKHNHTSNTTDTVGKGILEIGDSTLAYTPFSIDIIYTSDETPDSVTVFVDPSLVKRYPNRPWVHQVSGVDHIGGHTSFFWIDNLELLNGGTTSVGDADLGDKIDLYPNPAKDFIQFDNFDGVASIIDLSGRRLESIHTSPTGRIDISKLAAGTYLLQINNGKKLYQKKIIKL